jgi:hypothetical protein
MRNSTDKNVEWRVSIEFPPCLIHGRKVLGLNFQYPHASSLDSLFFQKGFVGQLRDLSVNRNTVSCWKGEGIRDPLQTHMGKRWIDKRDRCHSQPSSAASVFLFEGRRDERCANHFIAFNQRCSQFTLDGLQLVSRRFDWWEIECCRPSDCPLADRLQIWFFLRSYFASWIGPNLYWRNIYLFVDY